MMLLYYDKHIHFLLSTELNLTLSVDRMGVREGQSVQLVCTVKPAIDLVADILFVRRSGNTNVNCAHISQQISNCYVIVQDSDYQPFCSSEAYDHTASIKTYTLEIPIFRTEDFTEWWCQTKNHTQTYNTFTLVEAGK